MRSKVFVGLVLVALLSGSYLVAYALVTFGELGLRGTVTTPLTVVFPNDLNFGQVFPGSITTRTLNFTNRHAFPLNYSYFLNYLSCQMNCSGIAATIAGWNGLNTTRPEWRVINASQTVQLQVELHASNTIPFRGAFLVRLYFVGNQIGARG